MVLPPGPRATAAWQTLAWMARPGAFLTQVHERFGDPATIRTYWTEEPMVLYSGPGAVRDVFALDPAIAPAGRSWEFLRPFAGPDSILLLDGPPHIAERRLLQRPFHGEAMRGFAPLIAELAEREVASWRGRVAGLERMRGLTLEVILRVVFGARDDGELDHLRAEIERALATVRSLAQIAGMVLVRRDLGPRSPWGRFRVAVERFDAELYAVLGRRRAEAAGDDDEAGSVLALLLGQRDEHGEPPSDQHLRDQLVALLVGGHDSSAASLAWALERLSHHPAVQARLAQGDPDYLEATVREVLRVRPALTIAPRLLLEPATVGGVPLPAGVQVAACLWLAMRREDLWPHASAFRPERWLEGAASPDAAACADATASPHAPPSWIPFGGGVRRCAGSPFAEMEMREVLRAVSRRRLSPVRRTPERARRSMLVVVPERGAQIRVD